MDLRLQKPDLNLATQGSAEYLHELGISQNDELGIGRNDELGIERNDKLLNTSDEPGKSNEGLLKLFAQIENQQIVSSF